MSEISGSLFKNITESRQIKSGAGKVYGVVVNSHSSGTLKLGDGLQGTYVTYATGTLTSDATNVSDNDTVTIDTTVYRFKNTLAQAYDVKIGADAATSLDNLKAAINASGTPGTEYFAGTLVHPTVIATTNTNTTQVVQAVSPVAATGNAIVTTETSSHLSWGAGTLASGVNGNIVICNTFSFPTGSGVYRFPEAINFVNGLFATVGGTADLTILFN